MINLPPQLTTLATTLAQVAPPAGDQAPSMTSGDGLVSGGGAAGGGATSGGGGSLMLLLLPLMLVAMIFLSAMGGRKEKRRRAEMLGSLARHDRVRTTGGVIGTIMDIREDEVVLKVDEATNTRITFDKGAIQGVIKHAKGAGTAEAAAEDVQGDAEYATS